MDAEKVIRPNVAKKTGISSDSIPSRLPQRQFFTASKAPEQVQTEHSKPVFRKQTGTIRKTIAAGLMSLTLASTTPQFAYAGKQDEKSKLITKNELVSPDPTNAPAPFSLQELSFYNYFPGKPIIVLGRGQMDQYGKEQYDVAVDASSALNELRLSDIPQGTRSFIMASSDGQFINFLFLSPGAYGLYALRVSSTPQGEIATRLMWNGADAPVDLNSKVPQMTLENGLCWVITVGNSIFVFTPTNLSGVNFTNIMKEHGVDSIDKIKISSQPGFVVFSFSGKDGHIVNYGLSLTDGEFYSVTLGS